MNFFTLKNKLVYLSILTFLSASNVGCANTKTSQVNNQTSANNVRELKKMPINMVKLPNRSDIVIDFDEPRESQNFPAYVKQLKILAKQHGINDKTINAAFKDVHFIERVIKSDKNQPEKKITFSQYLALVVSSQKIASAKENMTRYQKQLKNASQITQVPVPYIVALWGVESGFGKIQGKEYVISALSTLAFEGRREAFFARELIAALHILQEGQINPSDFKGSWAGAMGQNQFMPSSYIIYGADGDNDGIIDIWNNINDVFVSVGNYLHQEGWDKNLRWGNRVSVPANINTEALQGLQNDKKKTVAQWKKLGFKFNGKEPSFMQDNLSAWLIFPDNDDKFVAYLVSNNFRVLMHWNRSYYFGISVGTLADKL